MNNKVVAALITAVDGYAELGEVSGNTMFFTVTGSSSIAIQNIGNVSRVMRREFIPATNAVALHLMCGLTCVLDVSEEYVLDALAGCGQNTLLEILMDSESVLLTRGGRLSYSCDGRWVFESREQTVFFDTDESMLKEIDKYV